MNLPLSSSPTASRSRKLVLGLIMVAGGTAAATLATTAAGWPSTTVPTTRPAAVAIVQDAAAHAATTTVSATTLPTRHVAKKRHAPARPKPTPTTAMPTTLPAPPVTAPPVTTPPVTAPPVTAPPVTAAPAPSVPQVSPTAIESQFFSLLNQTRAGVGLPALAWDGGLAGIARSWSATMASTGLHHNPDLTGILTEADPGWGAGGENVGVGASVVSLNTAFDNSPEHYANITKPGYTKVGIGVVAVNGSIWVTFDFVQI